MAGHRADDDRVAGIGDAAQGGDCREINKIGRLGKTQLQGRDQSHPTGDELCLLVGAEKIRDFVEARGLVIGEFVHLGSPYSAASGWRCCWITRHSFSGVAGMSKCRTPSGFSASTRALVIAAGAPIAPASPQPLTPSGLCVHRVTLVDNAKAGRSSARGIA